MANNKNQHFVPRCHLKPFTLDGEGLAINLYNLARKQLIACAPVKNQCSRDYFYGNDPDLEASLQALEGKYADVLRRLCVEPLRLNSDDAAFLASFWIFQHLRTEAIQKSMLKHSADMQFALGGDIPELALGKKEATLIALKAFAQNYDAIADLNLVIVQNRSSVPFVTSDNPAVQTNWLALLASREGVETFGMHSAGAIALLPLTPDLLAIMYDKDVYSIAHESRVIAVRRDADIRALNEHQVLNCSRNIYFSPGFTATHVEDIPDLDAQRKKSGPRILMYQRKSESDHRYYATERIMPEKGAEAIIATPTFYSSPTSWPGFIRWRLRGFYFENGSAVGRVRSAWTRADLATRPFRKVYTGR